MLRFAVRWPLRRAAFPRSHGMPCRDVPGRVHVSIAAVAASPAPEDSLALASLPVDDLALRARLARVRGIDLLNPAGGFVLEPGSEQGPGGGKDAPVESGFLLHAPARRFSGTPGRAGHVPHLEVLDADHVIAPGYVGAGFLCPVLPGISIAGLGASQLLPDLQAPAAAPLRPGQLPLKTCHRRRGGSPISVPVRQSQRHRNAPVDPDYLTSVRPRYRFRDGRECNMPPAGGVTVSPERLHPVRYRTGQPKPNPPALGHEHFSAVAVQLANALRLHRDNPESLIAASFPPCRFAMRAREEIPHRLVKIPQRLLLNHLAALREPRIIRARAGQLSALLKVAGCGLKSRPPVRMLFDREVPYEPGITTVPQQDSFLCSGRRKPVAGHARILIPGSDNRLQVPPRPQRQGFPPRYR